MFLQITSSPTSPIVSVVTNDFSPVLSDVIEVAFNKNFVIKMERRANYITISILNERPFLVTHELRTDSLKVDEVNGETPTDLADLHNKLKAIF